MYNAPKRKKRGPYKEYINHGSDFMLPRSTSRAHQRSDLSTDASLADDDPPVNDTAAGPSQAADRTRFSTERNCEFGADASGSDDEQLFMSDDDASQQQVPGELTSEEDMQTPDSSMGPGHGGKPYFGDLFNDVITERVVVSKGDILLMVLKHAVKNNLSFKGLTSILDLINRIFECPILPHSRYQLSKLLSKTGTTMSYFCFCPKCYTHIENAEANSSFQCTQCRHKTSVSSLSDLPFFVTLDVESQLQRLLKDCTRLDLTKPLHHDSSVADIWDGEMYRRFAAAAQHCGPRISFTLNADGTPIFKSSGTAIWPIQLIVNEVPAKQRMSKRVLAALWFWKEKPNMELFQSTFVEQMNQLSENGFVLERQGQLQTFKAYCICCAVDSVARAPMQGVTQFNGYFGCNWCLQKGERAGGSTKYPVESVNSSERTESQMLEDMQEAVTEGVTVHGVKTVSPLISLQHFNIVWGFVPDYMHFILLGIGRQFLALWFESSGGAYSLSREQHKIDERLMAIRPPRDLKRLPRPTKERKWWKAKELENWILYYSIPVLDGILDKKYLQHWACLVEALHIMLQYKIETCELIQAEQLLLEFHVRSQMLFGKAFMTFNMHQLTHIVKSIRCWGPLWAHSAFPFESGNGGLKQSVKAANGIPHQLCRVLQIENTVMELQDLASNPSVVQYCSSFDTKVTQKSVCSSDGTRFFGSSCQYTPPACPLPCDQEIPPHSVQYRRIMLNGSILTDSLYASSKKTNSSAVQLSDNSFAIIEQIIFSGDKTFISVKKLRCRPLKYHFVTLNHVQEVLHKESSTVILQPADIRSVCVFINLESAAYICAPPSTLSL
ncbi:uncharacterized protein [Dermacentor albipictus]|uniref:uncharacterized protein isoform X2 n=1 Tax=Dermacentor albipictus TaxID=60249 RepID=UPI0038FCCD5C